MLTCLRRYAMRKLYSVEERVPFFPGGSATAHGNKAVSLRVKNWGHINRSVNNFVTASAGGWRNSGPERFVLPVRTNADELGTGYFPVRARTFRDEPHAEFQSRFVRARLVPLLNQ